MMIFAAIAVGEIENACREFGYCGDVWRPTNRDPDDNETAVIKVLLQRIPADILTTLPTLSGKLISRIVMNNPANN